MKYVYLTILTAAAFVVVLAEILVLAGVLSGVTILAVRAL